MPSLVVSNISTGYSPNHPVLENLSLRVEDGGRLALVGASGSGKTTLFRAVAGFMDVANGSIHVGEREVSAPGLTINPERRGVGLVFQDLALFPHMTVERNIRYGLKGISGREATHRIDALLELTGLRDLRTTRPGELSGGQQQRVAVARALIGQPPLIIADEPTSSLDAVNQTVFLDLLFRQLANNNASLLMVSHDPRLGDRFDHVFSMSEISKIERGAA